jgi:hypothetical protein
MSRHDRGHFSFGPKAAQHAGQGVPAKAAAGQRKPPGLSLKARNAGAFRYGHATRF